MSQVDVRSVCLQIDDGKVAVLRGSCPSLRYTVPLTLFAIEPSLLMVEARAFLPTLHELLISNIFASLVQFSLLS